MAEQDTTTASTVDSAAESPANESQTGSALRSLGNPSSRLQTYRIGEEGFVVNGKKIVADYLVAEGRAPHSKERGWVKPGSLVTVASKLGGLRELNQAALWTGQIRRALVGAKFENHQIILKVPDNIGGSVSPNGTIAIELGNGSESGVLSDFLVYKPGDQKEQEKTKSNSEQKAEEAEKIRSAQKLNMGSVSGLVNASGDILANSMVKPLMSSAASQPSGNAQKGTVAAKTAASKSTVNESGEGGGSVSEETDLSENATVEESATESQAAEAEAQTMASVESGGQVSVQAQQTGSVNTTVNESISSSASQTARVETSVVDSETGQASVQSTVNTSVAGKAAVQVTDRASQQINAESKREQTADAQVESKVSATSGGQVSVKEKTQVQQTSKTNLNQDLNLKQSQSQTAEVQEEKQDAVEAENAPQAGTKAPLADKPQPGAENGAGGEKIPPESQMPNRTEQPGGAAEKPQQAKQPAQAEKSPNQGQPQKPSGAAANQTPEPGGASPAKKDENQEPPKAVPEEYAGMLGALKKNDRPRAKAQEMGKVLSVKPGEGEEKTGKPAKLPAMAAAGREVPVEPTGPENREEGSPEALSGLSAEPEGSPVGSMEDSGISTQDGLPQDTEEGVPEEEQEEEPEEDQELEPATPQQAAQPGKKPWEAASQAKRILENPRIIGKATSKVWYYGFSSSCATAFTGLDFFVGAIIMDAYWIFGHKKDKKIFPMKLWQKLVTIFANVAPFLYLAVFLLIVFTSLCNSTIFSRTLVWQMTGSDICKNFDFISTASDQMPSANIYNTNPAGTGRCDALTSGPASAANLAATCFGGNAQAASGIANAESGGNPLAASGVDKCQPGGEVVSWGLYQINISAHKIGGLNCPAAFSSMYTGSNKNCTIVDPMLYTQCVAAAKDPNLNIQAACQISQNGIHWGAWGANQVCGFTP